MFPFGFKSENWKDTISLFKERSRNEKIWEILPYKIQTGFDYNEYVYFYPYIRNILFTTTQQENQKKNSKGVYFFKASVNRENGYFKINYLNTDNKPDSIKLALKNIFLHFFESGVGILIFEIVNDPSKGGEYLSLRDYLRFMSLGRRVYCPFVRSDTEISEDYACNAFNPVNEKEKETPIDEKGIFKSNDAIHLKECPDSIELKINDDIPWKADFKSQLFFYNEKEKGYYPSLSNIITKLLDTEEFNYKNGDYWSIIDDRMFVHSFFDLKNNSASDDDLITYNSNRKFLDSLKQQFRSGFPATNIDDSANIWYQMIHIDGEEPTCQNPRMMEKILQESSYGRWSDYGTFFGFSRFSSVTISNLKDAGYTYNHFQSMYYQIAVMLLFYRGAILDFSRRSSDLADSIHGYSIGHEQKNTKDEKKSTKEIHSEIKRLHSDFLLFRNKFWFREVTAQDQGIDIFSIWSHKLKNFELLQDVKSEIDELYNYIDAEVEKDVSKKINILTILGAIAIPLAIVTSFFGMNLSFIEGLEDKIAEIVLWPFNQMFSFLFNKTYIFTFHLNKIQKYFFSFFLFCISFWIFYQITRKIFINFVDKEKFEFPKLRELFELII